VRVAAGVIAVFLLASRTGRSQAAEAAAPRQAAQVKVYEHKLFSITLPEGWKVVREREEATPPGNYPEKEAGGAARFEDDKGNFFEVIIPCQETDVAGDAMWHCRYDAATRSVVTCAEQPPCTQESQEECLKIAKETEFGDDNFCLCTAGDGRLTIWATLGEVDLRNTCFLFGNSRRETGVDLAVFREMLKSFRAKGQPGRRPSDAE
jgi:hypothetical protein